MSQYQSKSLVQGILEKILAASVLLVASGILILVVTSIVSPSHIFQVETLSFTLLFLGIGLIAITARILEALN